MARTKIQGDFISASTGIVAVPWKEVDPEIPNPVRNTSHEYLKFINTRCFSEEAVHFLKHGYYTNAPYGTKDYNDYWDEQERRCIAGHTIGGVRITGRHYYFLNFCMIKARPIDPITGAESDDRKIITFPRFLDHQYYLFHELEECFAEGPHNGKPMRGLVAFKARRKGFTYFTSGGVYGYNYNFVPASNNILAAYEKASFKVTLDGIHFSLNHINKNTDWAKRRDKINKRDWFRASFLYHNEMGLEIEDGYMSEVRAVSFKDDPFKSIGESVFLIGFEEAGAFPGLLDALTIAEPTYRDGNVMTGIPLIWGSAGDEGDLRDLEELFENPEPYGLKAYENIYSENATGNCGWFIDDLWYHPGTYSDGVYMHTLVDTAGNSYRQLADKALDKKRALRKTGDKRAYNKFLSQQCKTPEEGFLRTEVTIFDVVALKARLSYLLVNRKTMLESIWKAALVIDPETNKVKYTNDTDGSAVYEFPLKDNKEKVGTIEIYAHPVKDSEGTIPQLRYIAGIDSYDDDASDTMSVGSCIVLDRFRNEIVAHYKGRPDTKTFYENCRRLLMYYNATANYERRNKGIYGHFYNMNSLYLLCDEPDILKDKGISKANTIGNNSKGTYPSLPVKSYGNSLMVKWLDSLAYGEEGESGITNNSKIRSVPLLKELTYWSPDEKKNYDDVDAFRMLVIYLENLSKYEIRERQKANSTTLDPYWSKWRKPKDLRTNRPSLITMRFRTNQ